MRRSASEIIRNLEMRIAKLERSAGKWEVPWEHGTSQGHPAMINIRTFLVGTKLLGFELEISDGRTMMWSKGDDVIYISAKGNTLYFYRPILRGIIDRNIINSNWAKKNVIGKVNLGRHWIYGDQLSFIEDFLEGSEKILAKI